MRPQFRSRHVRVSLRLWCHSCCASLLCAGLLLTGFVYPAAVVAQRSPKVRTPRQTSPRLAARDEALLEDMSRRAFRFFWEQADASTGLVRDRARTDGSPHDETHRNVASIAATGFGLTALCIAAERRWIEPREALERARATLRFFATRALHEHGWFYHWMDTATGERRWQSEVSSIDTAL
ncbi:MAG: hypothetical protein LC747_06090, partial [Acidobacteria bacterium]|nr:hypothetical protein [Acidobacteriota bacterium]